MRQVDCHSLLVPPQSAERIPERNHDGLCTGAGERHLQVSAIFNLSVKLAKLIGDRVHHMSPHVGKNDARALAKPPGKLAPQ